MELEFSRAKLSENISELIKQKNMRVSDVELKIGISSGYLSKLLKKDTDSAPSADIIWKLSKVLGVSTDMLIEGDFSGEKGNLSYMSNFILKLKLMTEYSELEWKKMTVPEINNILVDSSVELPIIDNNSIYPVLGPVKDEFSGLNGSYSSYKNRMIKSAGVNSTQACVTNTSFYTKIEEDTDIYIFPMRSRIRLSDDGEFADFDYYDVYFAEHIENPWHPDLDDDDYDQVQFQNVFNTYNIAKDLNSDVESLYRCLVKHENDFKISHSVRNTIDRFMIDDKDIPF